MPPEKQTRYQFFGGESFLLSDDELLKSVPIVSMGRHKGKIVASVPIAPYTIRAEVSD